jgi:hypothetical protein
VTCVACQATTIDLNRQPPETGDPRRWLLVGASWRWIFVINIPIGILTVIVGRRIISKVREGPGARLFDVASAVALLIPVTAVVLATVQGPSWEWGDAKTIGLFVLAAAAARVADVPRGASDRREGALRQPMFGAATVGLLLFFCGFAIFLLGSALLMQDVWHFSAVKAGVCLTPAPVTASASRSPPARSSDASDVPCR